MNKGRRHTDLAAPLHTALYGLLGSQILIAALLFGALPIWVPVSAILMFLTCGLILYRGWPLPASIFLVGLGLSAMLGVWLWFHTLNGASAGVSLLLLIAAIKTFETRTTRDLMVVALSAYLLTTSLFLFDQSIPRSAFALLNLIWLTAILQQMQTRQISLPLRRHLGSASGRIAFALPLMLILFVLFPRIEGPLWGRVPDRHKAVTGLSDHMSPGDISQLVRSRAIAFRAHIQGPPPPPRERYWRAYVLDRFNGVTWLPPAKLTSPTAELNASGSLTRYTLLLQGSGQRGIPTLGLPIAAPPGTRLVSGYTLRADRPVNTVHSFLLRAALGHSHLGAQLSSARLMPDLNLPANDATQARALAEHWATQDPHPSAIIARALRYFHDQPFYYTLNPPHLQGDITDKFLFDTRQGFCEDYASAFAVLMRAAGIPARIVVGYMGGSWNSTLHYFTVRNADAHAWVEVWLQGQGWVRVDPTAAVAASRIETGAGVTGNGGLGLSTANQGWFPQWTRALRSGWDTAGYLWDTWVVAFGPAEQRALLHRLGLKADWGALARYLAISFGLLAAMGFVWTYWRQRPPVLPLDQRLYRRYLRRLKRHGLRPLPGEGALDFALRIGRHWPAHAQAALEIARRYHEVRYAPVGPGDSLAKRLAKLRKATTAPLTTSGTSGKTPNTTQKPDTAIR